MLIQANALQIPIASETVQCVVTSPPYWGLRDYGTARWEGGDVDCPHTFKKEDSRLMLGSDGSLGKNCTSWTHRDATPPRLCACGARRIDSQLGLESTPEEFVANMVAVFREVWRVLRKDGTCWVNLGDSYASNGQSGPHNGLSATADLYNPRKNPRNANRQERIEIDRPYRIPAGLKPKDLVGIPWRTAFALQADGWYLRSDIIWHKPNPMPESVTDRPTKAHEYLFLLAKGERYYYDAEAIAEPSVYPGDDRGSRTDSRRGTGCNSMNGGPNGTSRNKRTVWTIATQPYSGAHFATFPEKLVEPCILAGSRPGDYVLDPFVGSGTVIRVATRHQRKGVGTDLNMAYLTEQATRRTRNVQVQMSY